MGDHDLSKFNDSCTAYQNGEDEASWFMSTQPLAIMRVNY